MPVCLSVRLSVLFAMSPSVLCPPDPWTRYVLSTDLLGAGFSSHWAPYWRACTPCHFPYDVIVKLETGEDDLAYLWQRTGLDSQVIGHSIDLGFGQPFNGKL